MTEATTDSPGSGEDRRRSERQVLHLPVEMEGETAQGQPTSGPAEVVAVSKHGALIKVRYELLRGSTVKIKNPANGMEAEFRVIWASSVPLEASWNIGLESQTAPPELWQS